VVLKELRALLVLTSHRQPVIGVGLLDAVVARHLPALVVDILCVGRQLGDLLGFSADHGFGFLCDVGGGCEKRRHRRVSIGFYGKWQLGSWDGGSLPRCSARLLVSRGESWPRSFPYADCLHTDVIATLSAATPLHLSPTPGHVHLFQVLIRALATCFLWRSLYAANQADENDNRVDLSMATPTAEGRRYCDASRTLPCLRVRSTSRICMLKNGASSMPFL
jgi:hypothetical protein